MAERRMFAKTIVLSDAFLDMPLSARCLYFTLGMLGDDDGFINSPKSIMRQCGASIDDLNILIAKKFLIPFDSGVVVVKHWRINNYLRNDRYQETKYIEERNSLRVEENGSYTVGIPKDGIPKDGIPSREKDSIDKDNYYLTISREGKTENVENSEDVETSETDSEFVDRMEKEENAKLNMHRGTVMEGLMLSTEQINDLCSRLSLDEFDHYCKVVSDQVKAGRRYGKTHYQAILDMVDADRRVRDPHLKAKKRADAYRKKELDRKAQEELQAYIQKKREAFLHDKEDGS